MKFKSEDQYVEKVVEKKIRTIIPHFPLFELLFPFLKTPLHLVNVHLRGCYLLFQKYLCFMSPFHKITKRKRKI
jgi:hypothetical protein